MGTSSSARGPGKGAPLIPPWADPQGQPAAPSNGAPQTGAAPMPAIPTGAMNLRGFRTALGNVVARGLSTDTSRAIGRALGRHARATGGGATAAKRLASPIRSGARVFALLGGATVQGLNKQSLTLANLDGQNVRTVVDALVDALVPRDGDRDRVAAALQNALSTALAGAATFDQNALTPDVLANMVITYLRDVIFQTIIADSDRAFQRVEDHRAVARMEGELLAVVEQVVNDEARPLLDGATFSEGTLLDLQSRAVSQVWDFWEALR